VVTCTCTVGAWPGSSGSAPHAWVARTGRRGEQINRFTFPARRRHATPADGCWFDPTATATWVCRQRGRPHVSRRGKRKRPGVGLSAAACGSIYQTALVCRLRAPGCRQGLLVGRARSRLAFDYLSVFGFSLQFWLPTAESDMILEFANTRTTLCLYSQHRHPGEHKRVTNMEFNTQLG
jgi:hypothetical protein